MSKLHKALSESPNVLTAKDLNKLKAARLNWLAKKDAAIREYAEELARASKLAQASKKKRKGAK